MEELSAGERGRYARHLMLPQVGIEGQRLLKAATIACVGAGGLASSALLYLAAAGIGRLRIIDDDTVDLSNLQRQIIHSTAAVGQAKVESARVRLAEVNPEVEVDLRNSRLSAENALELLADCDIVLDGTDNIPTRYLLNDACEILGLPWVHASVFRFEGQLTTFNLDGGPNYRDLLPKPPPADAVPSCADAGVLGVLPGTMGVLQATEVVKMVLGIGEPLTGRLLLFDAAGMVFREFRYAAIEGRSPATALDRHDDYTESVCEADAVVEGMRSGQTRIGQMRPNEYIDKRRNGWAPFLLDVRRAVEESIVSLPGTDLRIGHREVLTALDRIPEDRDIVVYCRTGKRSNSVAGALIQHGWPAGNVWNLAGGVHAWSDEIDPTVPKY